jgi:hypothetical protein
MTRDRYHDDSYTLGGSSACRILRCDFAELERLVESNAIPFRMQNGRRWFSAGGFAASAIW